MTGLWGLLATMAAWMTALSVTCQAQADPQLRDYLQQHIRLTDAEIASIRQGKAVVKALPSRKPGEIFLFGAIYVNAPADRYIAFARDFDRLRRTPGYLAIELFSSPPQLSDLEGFSLDREDIQSLKKCKPGNCKVQLPGTDIAQLRDAPSGSAPDAAERINSILRRMALERLNAYQRDGNRGLGAYHDKEHPADIAEGFAYMLSHARALPEYLTDCYHYLLLYPQGKPANTEDAFYWAKVRFGLKPTLRIVHVVTMRTGSPSTPSYVIAEKQLYASHYFRTALDLTFCAPESGDGPGRGFYLIKVMGSEQAGLTGLKGSLVRHMAVKRSLASLKKSLSSAKAALEARP